ncbi:MAG: erythromycin esterase family protein [Saprospirales bacterium]|nr:MAG: erythromycin esterase family protein [Saprospirales bacterium]
MNIKLILALMIFCIYSCSSNSQTPDIDEADLELFNHLKEQAIEKSTEDLVNTLAAEMGNKKLVLMGESTHGTSEYYTNRYLLSKKLVEDYGFSFIAVEGDWTAIYKLNLYVRGKNNYSSGEEIMKTFDRWPEWMWGNREFLELVQWLRDYNSERSFNDQVGLYGMDVYGQWAALEDLKSAMLVSEAEYSNKVLDHLQCFSEHKGDEWSYARGVARRMIESCEPDVNWAWRSIMEAYDLSQLTENNYPTYHLLQKAKVIKNAERHFRLSSIDSRDSWNSRVSHFWNTVNNLLVFYGPQSKGIAWAHNTHVGDARASMMSQHGQKNIGQLSREALGESNVYILGFATYKGKVNAGSSWGESMKIMEIPPAQRNSWEHLLNEISKDQFVLLFDSGDRYFPPLMEPRGNRAIGVTYNPQQESGNYVPTLLAHRYDAIWFIGETSSLVPIK